MKVCKATVDGARLSLQGLQAESDLRAMANSADEKDQEIAEKQSEYDARASPLLSLRCAPSLTPPLSEHRDEPAEERRQGSAERLARGDRGGRAGAPGRGDEAAPGKGPRTGRPP